MRKILVSFFMFLAVAGWSQATNGKAAPSSQQKEVLTIKGTVLDAASKKAAAGVRLQVEKFSATITDGDGKFTLKVPSYNAVVIISGEGFSTRQEALKGRKVLELQLLDESAMVPGNQVTLASGSISKRNSTAAD